MPASKKHVPIVKKRTFAHPRIHDSSTTTTLYPESAATTETMKKEKQGARR
jgi:hypothetical protein